MTESKKPTDSPAKKGTTSKTPVRQPQSKKQPPPVSHLPTRFAAPAGPAVLPGADSGAAVTSLDDRQLRVLAGKAKEAITPPSPALIVGEPVEVIGITYGGRPRVGIRAQCRKSGNVHELSLADLAFPPESAAARVVWAYRAWMGLGELPLWAACANAAPKKAVSAKRRKVAGGNITLGEPVELVVLACKSQSLQCRILGKDVELTLRTSVDWHSPGEIITVVPTRHWTHAKHSHLTGTVESHRADVSALGLVPLPLREYGDWDPKKHYWGEAGQPIEAWAKPIIAGGVRPIFEFRQVLPGADPEDFDANPLSRARKLNLLGDIRKARELLMDLLAQDLRCLDAHAHLGDFLFEGSPELAVRHFAMGVSIGQLSLGQDFGGVLPWGLLDNRPFLRCYHGLAQCQWRLGKFREAAALLRKMLWMNPTDNQGARVDLAAVEAGEIWEAT